MNLFLFSKWKTQQHSVQGRFHALAKAAVTPLIPMNSQDHKASQCLQEWQEQGLPTNTGALPVGIWVAFSLCFHLGKKIFKGHLEEQILPPPSLPQKESKTQWKRLTL